MKPFLLSSLFLLSSITTAFASIEFSAPSFEVTEGSVVYVRVRTTVPVSQITTAQVQVVSGSATLGGDLVNPGVVSVTFYPQGLTEKRVRIEATADGVQESREQASVRILSVNGTTPSPLPSATIFVNDSSAPAGGSTGSTGGAPPTDPGYVSVCTNRNSCPVKVLGLLSYLGEATVLFETAPTHTVKGAGPNGQVCIRIFQHQNSSFVIGGTYGQQYCTFANNYESMASKGWRYNQATDEWTVEIDHEAPRYNYDTQYQIFFRNPTTNQAIGNRVNVTAFATLAQNVTYQNIFSTVGYGPYGPDWIFYFTPTDGIAHLNSPEPIVITGGVVGSQVQLTAEQSSRAGDTATFANPTGTVGSNGRFETTITVTGIPRSVGFKATGGGRRNEIGGVGNFHVPGAGLNPTTGGGSTTGGTPGGPANCQMNGTIPYFCTPVNPPPAVAPRWAQSPASSIDFSPPPPQCTTIPTVGATCQTVGQGCRSGNFYYSCLGGTDYGVVRAEGRVVEYGTNQPVANAEVIVGTANPVINWQVTTRTDAQGRYSVIQQQFSLGQTVTVNKEGYSTYERGLIRLPDIFVRNGENIVPINDHILRSTTGTGSTSTSTGSGSTGAGNTGTGNAGTGAGTGTTTPPPPPPPPTTPTAVTGGVSGVTRDRATISGTTNANGATGTESFLEVEQLGITYTYARRTGGGLLSQTLLGLRCDTEYRFRAVITRSSGSVTGEWRTFNTLLCPGDTGNL